MNGRGGAGPAAADATFAASADGARWTVSGALVIANARAALAQARALPLPSSGVVDVARIGAVDSSAVAVLLAVKRGAAAQGREIAFAGVPEALASLASLYGVEEILGARPD